MINKKIHYIWFGKKPYPEIINKCMLSWKKKLPDYEFKLWNEDNSPIEIPYVKKALEKKYYAFAADYVRLYALYIEGGIYLDTDMEIVKDLSPLLNSKLFLGYESKDLINVAIIGSEKNHFLLKEIMQTLEQSNNYETIPKVITNIFDKNPDLYRDESIKIYPPKFFYPYNPYDPERKDLELMYMDIVEDTYAIHHWGKSWKLSFQDRLKRKINNFIKKN